MPGSLRDRLRRSIAETESRLVEREGLEETLALLVHEDAIAPDTAREIEQRLPELVEDSRYILRHLAAHLTIGVVFAFDVIPLPLGTMARVGWVAGGRLTETLRGHRRRARIHSTGVLLLAAIPWLGYSAYLLPLRRESGELAFVLANRSWLIRTGRTYEAFLDTSRRPVRRVGRWLVPRPDGPAAGSDDRADR